MSTFKFPFRRVSLEEQIALESMARRVEADLNMVGIPVQWTGNSADGIVSSRPGAAVFFEPVVDAPPGVYIRWELPEEMFEIILSAGPESTAATVGGMAIDVMLDALGKILASMGWRVDKNNIGVHESCIKIIEKRPDGFSQSK